MTKSGEKNHVAPQKGKRRGPHRMGRLSALKVRNMKRPGLHADGGALFLRVLPTGGKNWVLRIMVRGRRHDIGLGSAQLVTLAEARAEAVRLRRLARAGGDPLAERRKGRANVPTFEEAARKVWEANRATWKNAKHAAQWLSTIETYANPTIGKMPVGDVTSGDVLRVLSPIWVEKPETARRVKQRLGVVFDWCIASGHCVANPVNGVETALPRAKRQVRHQRALAYSNVPGFLEKLRAVHSTPALALEFLTLAATRTSEVLQARWSEFDIEARTWEIPAERMKAGKPHKVPLSDRALEILAEIGTGEGDNFVFMGRKPGKPLSNMALLMLMRRAGVEGVPHGMRSAFRDWCAEATRTPREVAEACLAHEIGNVVERAYRRSDLFDKRKALMDSWATFCTAKPADKVVQLHGKA